MTNGSRSTSGEEPVGELFAQLGHQVGELVGKEMQLARSELREELRKGVKATASLSAAAIVGLVAVVFLSSAAAWGLAEVMAPGLAFLIVGAVQVAVAAVLFLTGRRQAAEVDPVPHQTVETLKEDARWAKSQKS
ncbi:MAG TPA: phage holin family protein [Acidimicrobiales bacterium]|nr:phage holin family protein [Acidimicrobiales bacterium]